MTKKGDESSTVVVDEFGIRIINTGKVFFSLLPHPKLMSSLVKL